MTDTPIAIAGLGTVGRAVARELHRGIPGLALACVASGDHAKARAWLDAEGIDCPVAALADLPDHADVAVESAPSRVLEEICRPMLAAGKTVVVLSSDALLPRQDLIDLATSKGGRIIVPTGALGGLDAVAAAAEGHISSVRLVTRKPPRGLAGAPYLQENGISVEGLTKPVCIFSGSARDAAIGFPSNVNVGATLSLAGIGPDRTSVEIWADPGAARNCHTIEVEADSAKFSLTIENVPSENPKTGRIVALSVLATLRKLAATLRAGT